MTRPIPEHVWLSVRSDYFRLIPPPTGNELGEKYGISGRSVQIKVKAEGWHEIRQMTEEKACKAYEKGLEVGRGERKKRKKPRDRRTILSGLIGDLSDVVPSVDPKSREGCARALIAAIQAENELFPVTVEGLVEIAMKANIRPEQFLKVLQTEWDRQDLEDGYNR